MGSLVSFRERSNLSLDIHLHDSPYIVCGCFIMNCYIYIFRFSGFLVCENNLFLPYIYMILDMVVDDSFWFMLIAYTGDIV